MLDSLTPESIFAELMMNEDDVRAFLLVEGPDEIAILFGHVAEGVSPIVCGGKKNVIGAAGIAARDLGTPVIGLVDRDFDGLRVKTSTVPRNVTQTTTYDLLSDVIHKVEGSIRRVMSAHSVTGTALIENRRQRSAEGVVLEVGCGLASVRLASLNEGFPLIFKNYDFTAVLDATSECPGALRFVDGARCKDPSFTATSIVLDAIDRASKSLAGDVHRVGGHDIVGIIVGLLRGVGSGNISRKSVEASLITCATPNVLRSLDCISRLVELGRSEAGMELFDLAA
ncbi:DUF4435 domain-containing protein [Curtobacterium sp. MR_MD2014]|uniref:DUF4435 domain-containing protein n=1 Tax=Curtobacterium sp. MR_MD2014 TaxID=1561023 RepID=UPI0009E00171|nr:DUF4435 domain-containing protein [Curtobacterium sp. MR_MD2014]